MKTNRFLILIILFAISGCQRPIHSGTIISDEQINSAINLKFTKDEIEERFGSPNITPDYTNDTWYYVHRDMSKRAFFNTKVQSQRIVKVTFKNNYVDNIEVQENSHNSDVKIVKEFIKSKGSEKNPVQEYIQNFGRFNKYKKEDKRR